MRFRLEKLFQVNLFRQTPLCQLSCPLGLTVMLTATTRRQHSLIQQASMEFGGMAQIMAVVVFQVMEVISIVKLKDPAVTELWEIITQLDSNREKIIRMFGKSALEIYCSA
jgi:hypothetical protein